MVIQPFAFVSGYENADNVFWDPSVRQYAFRASFGSIACFFDSVSYPCRSSFDQLLKIISYCSHDHTFVGQAEPLGIDLLHGCKIDKCSQHGFYCTASKPPHLCPFSSSHPLMHLIIKRFTYGVFYCLVTY